MSDECSSTSAWWQGGIPSLHFCLIFEIVLTMVSIRVQHLVIALLRFEYLVLELF